MRRVWVAFAESAGPRRVVEPAEKFANLAQGFGTALPDQPKRFEDLALGVESRMTLLSMKFFETKVDRLLRKSMTGEPTRSGERVPPDVLVQAG